MVLFSLKNVDIDSMLKELNLLDEDVVFPEVEAEPVKGTGEENQEADIAIEPKVELDKEYKEITFINCNGRLEGDKVVLTDIEPFGFVGFEVK